MSVTGTTGAKVSGWWH